MCLTHAYVTFKPTSVESATQSSLGTRAVFCTLTLFLSYISLPHCFYFHLLHFTPHAVYRATHTPPQNPKLFFTLHDTPNEKRLYFH